MKMSIQNACAKKVLEMIEKGDGIKSIQAYCKGFGVDTTNYSSPVHVSEQGQVSVRNMRKMSYFTPHAGF